MKSGYGAGKLERIAETISISLTELPVASGGTYEHTASGDRPRRPCAGFDGIWSVVSHMVGDVPFAEKFAEAKLGEGTYDRLDYESTFEFTNGSCVKRMRITARVDGETAREFEYSLSLAFAYRAHGSSLEALPLMGYQTTRFDGEISSMKELPRSGEWMCLNVVHDGDIMTITDGDDVKTLERTGP